MKVDMSSVKEQAEREIHEEARRVAVEREKARIRAKQGMSLWQRLIEKLPYTIERKRT
ncbi:MAG TPA: hypothetical protein VF786_03985 [Terriglobales bacterium]